MPNQKDRVIIDTNLWISFLLTRDFSKLDSIIADSEVDFIFSQELINEIVEVTQRIKFRKYFNLDDVESLLIMIKSRAVFINVTSSVNKCRDPKDNFSTFTFFRWICYTSFNRRQRFGQTEILKITKYLGNE